MNQQIFTEEQIAPLGVGGSGKGEINVLMGSLVKVLIEVRKRIKNVNRVV